MWLHHTTPALHVLCMQITAKCFQKEYLKKKKTYMKSPVLEMILLIKMVSVKHQDLMHGVFCCGEDFEHENGCSNVFVTCTFHDL